MAKTNVIPSWWSPPVASAVAQRDAMPDVCKWQSTYVRYCDQHEAVQTKDGWSLWTSRTAPMQGFDGQRSLKSFPGFENLRSCTVNMKVIRSPAEFAIPVKQDRRLSPNFKLRVEVQCKGPLSVELTVKAHLLSQQEFDSITSWCPEPFNDCDEGQRKHNPGLKGQTVVTHHFGIKPEPSDGDFMHIPGGQGSAGLSHMLDHSAMARSTLVRSSASGENFGAWGQFNAPSITDAATMLRVRAGSDYADVQEMCGDSDRNGLSQFLVPPSGKYQSGLNPYSVHGLPLSSCLQTEYSLHLSRYCHSFPPPPCDELLDQAASTMPYRTHVAPSADLDPVVTIAQDYEFSNLEFTKPTRMNKVYLVFACWLLEDELLYVAYNIPTVGICRAEQKEKACLKLGLEFSELKKLESFYHSPPAVSQEVESGVSEDGDEEIKVNTQTAGTSSSESLYVPLLLEPQSPTAKGLVVSQPEARQLVLELYKAARFTRKLTADDVQALLKQAGFMGSQTEDTCTITLQEWEAFTGQLAAILASLNQISDSWNAQDPCVVAGFAVDRVRAVELLEEEPVGTFICRFSLSQPGSLVVSCKVHACCTTADEDGLIHAIIQVEDLQSRRLSTWLRDFVGATHILDVDTRQRVDKRKVFSSPYVRLKALQAYVQSSISSTPAMAW